uniref:Odorant receptor n=1 Tax=Bradysia odoriphaga TaxID=1564500 RepID=A0A6B9CFU4_9DIPT|nr:odorant receptor 13 [Bradysia odoriphaga]
MLKTDAVVNATISAPLRLYWAFRTSLTCETKITPVLHQRLTELHIIKRRYALNRLFAMHTIGIHKVMKQLISLFYWMGIWYRGDVPTVRETRIRTFYFCYFLLTNASVIIGAITSENIDESIFLVSEAILSVILSVKLWILIWKQKEILELLDRICVFSIRYDEDVAFFNKKLGKLMKFVVAFLLGAFVICMATIIVTPCFTRQFLVDIAFPLDYKNNDVAFWIQYVFLVTEMGLVSISVAVTPIIWYLMYNCSLRYEVLGKEVERMGRSIDNGKKKKSKKEKHQVFFQDLRVAIDTQLHLKELIDELASFASNLFLIKFGTSGMSICGSVYSLAYYVSDVSVETLYHIYTIFYYVFELFMITYFGNEIMLCNSRLSYSLFESDWIEQPQLTQKCIIIFREYLKQPQVLVIGKLYPLTLESFTRILNSAYSLFNILKNTKQ